MRAGQLDRVVTLQRLAVSVSAAGTVTYAWADFASVRAELVSVGHAETATAFGEQDTAALALVIRFRADITSADRLIYAGEAFNIVVINEIGRRRGLELTCQRVTT